MATDTRYVVRNKAPAVSAIPHAMMMDPNLSVGAKALYGVLAVVATHDTPDTRSGEIARPLGSSDRSVRTWLAELKRRGYADVTSKRGSAPIIELNYSSTEKSSVEQRKNLPLKNRPTTEKFSVLEATPPLLVSSGPDRGNRSIVSPPLPGYLQSSPVIPLEDTAKNSAKMDKNGWPHPDELREAFRSTNAFQPLRDFTDFKPGAGFWDAIERNYSGLDLVEEVEKMSGWIRSHRGRKMSTAFVLNWLKSANGSNGNGRVHTNGRTPARRSDPEDQYADFAQFDGPFSVNGVVARTSPDA